jgi:hypothetical protein
VLETTTHLADDVGFVITQLQKIEAKPKWSPWVELTSVESQLDVKKYQTTSGFYELRRFSRGG